VVEQGVFDLGWADPIPARDDHVVVARGEPQPPLVVLVPDVVGVHPLALRAEKRIVGQLWGVPVLPEHHGVGRFHRDRAFFAGR